MHNGFPQNSRKGFCGYSSQQCRYHSTLKFQCFAAVVFATSFCRRSDSARASARRPIPIVRRLLGFCIDGCPYILDEVADQSPTAGINPCCGVVEVLETNQRFLVRRQIRMSDEAHMHLWHPRCIILINTFRRRVQKDGAFNSAERIVSKVLIGRAEGACMPAAACPDQTMGRDNPLVRGRE